MSKEKPYTPYFDEKSRWWKVKGPSQVDAGWTREDHAQRHADDLNAAFSAGAVTREEVSESVDIESLIEDVADHFGGNGIYHPGGDYMIDHRGPNAADTARIIARYTLEQAYAHPPLAAKVEPRDPKEGEAPWIPVGERLPEMNPDTGDSEEVLLAYPTRQEERPFEYSAGWVQYLRDGGHRFIPRGGKPTHWMPLPTPPPTPS